MKRLLFAAICLALSGTVLLSRSPDKIHFLYFEDSKGVTHTYKLAKPVSTDDALAMRSTMLKLAAEEHAKGASFADDFLRAAADVKTGDYRTGTVCSCVPIGACGCCPTTNGYGCGRLVIVSE